MGVGHGDDDDPEYPGRQGRYNPERLAHEGDRYRGEGQLSRTHALRTERDPRTFTHRADRWGGREFIVPASDAATGNGLRSRATIVDTREFEVSRAFALLFRFQAVQSALPLPGPFSPLASNWFPNPSFNCNVRLRLSLGPEGGVSETLYTNDNSAVPIPFARPTLVLPRVVLGTKVQIDVECLGGFGESGTNSGYAEVWCAPLETVQPVSLVDHRGGDLLGNHSASTSRFAVTAVGSSQILNPDVSRRQFIIQNNSTQRMAVLFINQANRQEPQFTAGAERWTLIIVPNGIYESPIGGFCGEVRAVWEAADATGEALVTDVRVP